MIVVSMLLVLFKVKNQAISILLALILCNNFLLLTLLLDCYLLDKLLYSFPDVRR